LGNWSAATTAASTTAPSTTATSNLRGNSPIRPKRVVPEVSKKCQDTRPSRQLLCTTSTAATTASDISLPAVKVIDLQRIRTLCQVDYDLACLYCPVNVLNQHRGPVAAIAVATADLGRTITVKNEQPATSRGDVFVGKIRVCVVVALL
jgi:hypothetical protein